MYLFLKTAAVQLVVFTLETLGFSQDCIDLKVDHIGHLKIDGRGLQYIVVTWCVAREFLCI